VEASPPHRVAGISVVSQKGALVAEIEFAPAEERSAGGAWAAPEKRVL